MSDARQIMELRKTPLRDVFVLGIEPSHDVRGFFARTWCAREFASVGLPDRIAQISMSRTERRGTVRGMHMQLPPSREAKIVRCTRGAIHDVVIDLDPCSLSYLQHFAVELSAHSYQALYIPPLTLHGFQTLEDGTEVLYLMTDFHVAELGYGARWDDPAFGIHWPIRESITILPRDAAYPDFDRDRYRDELARFEARASVECGR